MNYNNLKGKGFEPKTAKDIQVEIEAQERSEKLIEAIAELLKLNFYFNGAPKSIFDKSETVKVNFEAILNREYIKFQKGLVNDIPIKIFADSEAERIEGLLNEIRKYGGHDQYSLNENYNVAKKYIGFLKSYDIESSDESPIKYAEKWYGITHKIMQELGIEDQFLDSSDKQFILQFGITKYSLETTGRAFYDGWRLFDANNMLRFLNSLTKDRNNWKKIISNISGNRNEVNLWLNKQSN